MTTSGKEKKVLNKIKEFLKDVKRTIIILQICEAILGLLGAGMVGYLFSIVPTPRQYVITALLVVPYFILFGRRLLSEQNYGLAALGELEATNNLVDIEAALTRKLIIDRYINDAVSALNSNTCNYSGSSQDQFLCDNSLLDGFKSVYAPFVYNTPSILNVHTSKFTVGVALQEVVQLGERAGANNKTYYSKIGPELLIARDDFDFSTIFPTEVFGKHHKDSSEDTFHLVNQVTDTFLHKKFVRKAVSIKGQEYTFLTFPIPMVCEGGDNRGVFFIIAETIEPSNDIAGVSIIFSRLFSNWLSKYEDCVILRVNRSDTAESEM